MRKIGIVLLVILISLVLTSCSSKLVFNSNGGTLIESIKVSSGKVIDELPVPKREGYTFAGWYLDKDLSEEVGPRKFSKNTELYAKWELDSYGFIIHYEMNKIEERSYFYDQILPEVSDYLVDGYTFYGWYLDKSFKEKYDLIKMPAQNVNLYAKLQPNVHKITFITNGGSRINQKNYNYDVLIGNAGEVPTLKDSTFIGWYLDSNLTKPAKDEKMPDRDIVLYAKWKNYRIVQNNIAKAKRILQSFGCATDPNIPDRCMQLSVNGLSIDFQVFYDNWNTKTIIFSIGGMYEGRAVWYSPDGLDSNPKYTVRNMPAPESEVKDILDRIPNAIKKIKQIEESFTNAGLSRDDLIWP